MKISFFSAQLNCKEFKIIFFGIITKNFKMVRKRWSLLIFYVLFEILQNFCCVSVTENDSFNPFSPQLNKRTELENSEFSVNRIFEIPPEEKTIAKRRLLVNENDLKSPTTGERQSDNEFWMRRRTNYSEMENEKQTSDIQEFNNWENGRNRISFPVEPTNSRNFADMHSRQPFVGQTNSNQQYNWEKRTDILDKSQSLWNEEKNFEQRPLNTGWGTGINFNNNGRPPAVIINDDENNAFSENENDREFNIRVPITTLNNEDRRNIKNYNNEKISEMSSGYLGHPKRKYYNKNLNGFWSPNFYTPEKGVIINFNTECPTPRQFNSQLVHKFIFTPKSPMSTHSEVNSFQIPGTALISTPRMTPMYYL